MTMRKELFAVLARIDAVCGQLNAGLAAVALFLSAILITTMIVQALEHGLTLNSLRPGSTAPIEPEMPAWVAVLTADSPSVPI